MSFGASLTRPATFRKQNPAEAGFRKKLKLTDKPGSVVDSHSSRPAIAHWLKQPTRVQYGPYHVNPYLALLRVDRATDCYQPRGALLPHPFTPYLIRLRGPSAVCSLLHWSWVSPGVTAALWSPDFPPSARLPERDDDEAATVWSASARSIEGLRAAVTGYACLQCGRDIPRGAVNVVICSPERLFQ